MKKLVLTLTATLVCLGAFAQGKLAFVNNNDQLIYFSYDKGKLVPADKDKVVGGVALAGSSLYTGVGSTIAALANTPTLVAALFGGTSSSSLTRLTTTTIGNSALGGFVNLVNVALPSSGTTGAFPSGVPAWFQFQIYDSRATSAADAWSVLNMYAGQSILFLATPQASYAAIYLKAAPVSSTMPSGTVNVLDYTGFPGYKGLIEVWATIPEPSTFALAGMGLASLLILRRRK